MKYINRVIVVWVHVYSYILCIYKWRQYKTLLYSSGCLLHHYYKLVYTSHVHAICSIFLYFTRGTHHYYCLINGGVNRTEHLFYLHIK